MQPQPSAKKTASPMPRSTPSMRPHSRAGRKPVRGWLRERSDATAADSDDKGTPTTSAAGTPRKRGPAKAAKREAYADHGSRRGTRPSPATPAGASTAAATATPADKATAERATPRHDAGEVVVAEEEAPEEEAPDADANEGQDEEAAAEPADEDEHAFKRFVDHRWAGNSLEILVEWEQGEATWEPEANLHQDARDSLLAYWRSQPDGRPTNPADADLYDILAIRKHSADRKRLLVEWVGYGPEDATWVSRAVVQRTAPDVVAAYWESVPRPRWRRARRM